LKRNLETYNIYKFSKNAINPKYDMLKLLHINWKNIMKYKIMC
jgi:hypothetical protein